MAIKYDFKNIINLALKIAYTIITTTFVIKFITSGDERRADNILEVFGFILIICFLPAIIAFAKKIRKEKVGKVTSFFVYMGFYTTFLFVITIFFYTTFQSRHYTYINQTEFANLITEYNKKNTENNFNANLFKSLFTHKSESSGILILELLNDHRITIRPFNYYYLINNYHNENIRPEKPEDINYIIIVNPDDYEYIGLYSDGKTKGYRLVIKIDSYKIENDEIRLLETFSEKGSFPSKYILASKDSIIRGGGGDIDIERRIKILINNIYK